MIRKNKTKLKVALPILSFLPNLGGMEVGLHNLATQLLKRVINQLLLHHIQFLKN